LNLPPYLNYKASGIEWLGDMPAHWEVTPTFRITAAIQTGPFGSQLHESDYVEGGIPLVNPAHIIDGRVVPDEQSTVDEATASRLTRHQLRTGDIIMGRRGEIGRCSVISAREHGWICGTGSLVVRPIDGCSNYFARIFSSAGFSKLLELNAVAASPLRRGRA
jgi:type I restriction enzyme, S subunit